MGLQLIDRAKMVPQVDGADREKNPQPMANTVGITKFSLFTLWVIADTRFDLPKAEDHLQLSREIGN